MTRLAAVLAAALLGACSVNPPAAPTGSAQPAPARISRAEYEQVFPQHSPFYSYDSFAAGGPVFASRRDAAAFLANVDHETGGLTVTVENPARRGDYCDPSKSYGCPAGRDAYYGRGPLQLSWNANYKDAGDALGLDLLNDPGLVSRDPALSWRTAAWFWNTYVPPGADFGETIRVINGPMECGGANREQVASRVASYQRITAALGVAPGENLTC